jgi:hypothetical protein
MMARPGEVGGPAGLTYAGALVRLGAAAQPAEALEALRRLRFTGWLAPPDGGWVVAVPARPGGTVAARRRGVIEVGAVLAAELRAPVVVVRVVRDRQLAIVGWRDAQEVARYVSDPSVDHRERAELLTEPIGVEDAAALAEICGRPDVEEKVIEVLSRELDPDSFIESERLAAVCNLLQLPSWLVSVGTLPREMPTGPRRADFTRLGAGAAAPTGVLLRWGSELLRRRHRQPPVVADPPRSTVDIDPWLL